MDNSSANNNPQNRAQTLGGPSPMPASPPISPAMTRPPVTPAAPTPPPAQPAPSSAATSASPAGPVPVGVNPTAPNPAGPHPTGPSPMGSAPNRPNPLATGPQPSPIAPKPATPGLASPSIPPSPTAPVTPSTPTALAPNARPGANPNPAANPANSATGPNSSSPASPSGPTVAMPNNPMAGPASKKAKKSSFADMPKNKKILYIVLGCVLLAVAAGCAAFAILSQMPKSQPTTQPPQNVAVDDNSDGEKEPIESLDKDGLLAALDDMQAERYIPEDLIADKTIFNHFDDGDLIYLTSSYENESDLKDAAIYGGDLTIATTPILDESAVLITALDSDGNRDSTQPSYLSFDKKYLDYQAGDTLAMELLKQGQSPITFTDHSAEYVEEVLPVLMLDLFDSDFASVYDYSLETSDDRITMDIYTIGFDTEGPDTANANAKNGDSGGSSTKSGSGSSSSSSSSSSAAATDDNSDEATDDDSAADTDADSGYFVTANHLQLIVDLNTGKLTLANFDGATEEELNSFPITEDEYKEYFAAS